MIYSQPMWELGLDGLAVTITHGSSVSPTCDILYLLQETSPVFESRQTQPLAATPSHLHNYTTPFTSYPLLVVHFNQSST
jgi:hypothetical protein